MQGTPEMMRLLFAPRSTIRWILNHDPNYGVAMIAILAGITSALRSSILHGLHPLPDLVGHSDLLDEVIAYGIGPSAGLFLSTVTIALYGALLGIVLIWVGSFFLRVIGRIFGGKGRYIEVRAALAWAFVPYTWLFPIYLIYAIVHLVALRSASFSYGTVLPWDTSMPLALLLGFDYLFRLLGFVLLVLNLSVALNVDLKRSFFVAFLIVAPPIFYFAPCQGFGF
ncbi:MAG: YIP1 family protein [bacterium]